MTEPLTIEITRSSPSEWRVVERTHRTTESAYRVSFEPEMLAALLKEIAVRLDDISMGDDGDSIRLGHLGSRLSEMILPPALREKLVVQSGQVEFFLDDESVVLPVELIPNQGGVLGGNVPVIRHWFCESSCSNRSASRKEKRQALIVADPAGNLPAAQKEGALVQRRFGRRKDWKCNYLSRSVTVEQLLWDLPGTDLLHLAAHYEAGTVNEQSGVVMADGRWLPSGASPAPELVFANCCRAGLPSDICGDLALAGHFLKHGARHVIAPFLPVTDETALKFASAFFAALDRNWDVAEAVLSARKELGPAGWMYWHFGSTSRGAIQEMPVPTTKKKRSFGRLLFLLALIFAAAVPWMKPVDTVSTSTSVPTIVTEQPSSDLLQPGEQPTGESAGLVAPLLEPIASGETASQMPVALIDEAITPADDVPTPSTSEKTTSKSEPAPLVESESVVVPPISETDQTVLENGPSPHSGAPITAEHNGIDTEPPEFDPDVEGNVDPIVSHEDPEIPAALESETGVPLEPVGIKSIPDIADSAPETPASDISIVVEQTQPATAPITAAPHKPGLFDDVLAEVDRQQSFEEAAIQVLEGYPERYLNATIKGKPDYNAATGKASVAVAVTIDNAKYRAMAQRLSEILRKIGHDGEQISATMERPYDSYMEIRFRFSGRKKFRDLLFLCIRANDALTQSEWEFHSLPRSSIDALLSSMSMPLLSVELTDSSGQTIASASQKIPRPFLATEERGFSILPAFNGERSEMTITSVIPGRNHLEVKMEFDLSLEELKRIADATCTIKKGTRLPDEFQYRFLRRE